MHDRWTKRKKKKNYLINTYGFKQFHEGNNSSIISIGIINLSERSLMNYTFDVNCELQPITFEHMSLLEI